MVVKREECSKEEEEPSPRRPRTPGLSRSFRMFMKITEYFITRCLMNLALRILDGSQKNTNAKFVECGYWVDVE